MALVTAIAAIVGGIVASILAAFIPMKLLVGGMEKRILAPIRNFIERQRDRRTMPRPTPDRRRGV